MGWEKRGNKFYYYDKKKINGKIVSIYCGQAIPDRILTKQAFNELLSKLSLLDNLFNLTKEQAIALLSSLPSYKTDFINNSFCELIKKDYKDLSAYTNALTINYLQFINLYEFFCKKKNIDDKLSIKIINKIWSLSNKYNQNLLDKDTDINILSDLTKKYFI